MTRFLTAVSLFGLLAACDNMQPLNFNTSEEGVTDEVLTNDEGEVILDEEGEEIDLLENGIPEPVGGTLDEVLYNRNTGTLEVTIRSLDSTPLSAVYERNTNLDVPGYIAYSQQEDPLDRFFIAMVQTSNDGQTQGVLVMDGGQFTKFFAGTNYTQEGVYSPPTASQPNNGLVSYTGNYVGILNADVTGGPELLVPTTGIPDDLLPGQPIRITGTALVNADFVDMTVNAGVANRRLADPSFLDTLYPGELLDIGLTPTDIMEDGSFYGQVDIGPDKVGNYGGIFGGSNASGVAIGVHLDGDFLPAVDGEEEYGLIVLTKCGLPGDGAFCPDAQPDF